MDRSMHLAGIPMNLMAISANANLRNPYKIVLNEVAFNDDCAAPNLNIQSVESQGDEDVDATRIGD